MLAIQTTVYSISQVVFVYQSWKSERAIWKALDVLNTRAIKFYITGGASCWAGYSEPAIGCRISSRYVVRCKGVNRKQMKHKPPAHLL
ncbi:hypothetical protein QVD17_41431 [Tagetes erecta]|uniref:Uncharacterized protein n=1 Tax=Tagetes erecta TaxID=13708 RepID=A0AAD8NDN7_TARER|nr:hypothetical protein QVD17_41431 [Tagetes erecta]